MITKRFLKKYYEQEGLEDKQKLEYSGPYHPLYITRKGIVEFLLDNLILTEGLKTFLEVGCSEGWYVVYAAHNVTLAVGIDISRPKIKRDYGKKRGHYLIADAEHLPFREHSFELVLCTEVLEHLLHPELCVKELFRASKNRVVITVPIKVDTTWDRIRGKSNFVCAPPPAHINEPDLKTLHKWLLNREWQPTDYFIMGHGWFEKLNSIKELEVLDFPFRITVKRLLMKICRRFSVPLEKPLFLAIALKRINVG